MSTTSIYTYRQKLADVVFPEKRKDFAYALGSEFERLIKDSGNSLTHFCGTYKFSYNAIQAVLSGQRPRSDLDWLLEDYEVTVYMANRIAKALEVPLSKIVTEVAKSVPCLHPFLDPITEDSELATPDGGNVLLMRRGLNKTRALRYNKCVKSVINKELKRKSISHRELARLSSVSDPAIYKLLSEQEHLDTLGNLGTYVSIAAVLGISVGELFTRADKMLTTSQP